MWGGGAIVGGREGVCSWGKGRWGHRQACGFVGGGGVVSRKFDNEVMSVDMSFK